jgi:HAD superfamily hydrolase (TIGR01509 family)
VHAAARAGLALPRDGLQVNGAVLDAIVFDLDGVLIDSESMWDDARRAVVADSGGQWSDTATRDMMGMSSREWSRYLHDRLGVAPDPDEISRRVVQRLLASYRAGLPLLDGAVATVRSLAADWTLGLASSANRPVIDAVLTGAHLQGCFTATVSSEEVPRGKPAPDVYLAAARALGVDPAQCAAVEDSANGLRAAAAAGMLVIAIPNRTFPPSADALAVVDLTVDSLSQLTPAAIRSAWGRLRGATG